MTEIEQRLRSSRTEAVASDDHRKWLRNRLHERIHVAEALDSTWTLQRSFSIMGVAVVLLAVCVGNLSRETNRNVHPVAKSEEPILQYLRRSEASTPMEWNPRLLPVRLSFRLSPVRTAYPQVIARMHESAYELEHIAE